MCKCSICVSFCLQNCMLKFQNICCILWFFLDHMLQSNSIYPVCLYCCCNNLFDFSLFEAGIVVRNTLVTYDRGNDKIGFLKTNCSELWRRVEFSVAPAPAPLVSQSEDTNMEIPPTLSPSGLQPNVLPGAWLITYLLTMFYPFSLVSSLAVFRELMAILVNTLFYI